MIGAKKVADLITWARATLSAWIPWLGISQGGKSFPLVVFLVVANWTADAIDGALARRSRRQYRTWIGDRDLEVDMLVSVGLLSYFSVINLIIWQIGAVYLLLWLLLFWRFGLLRILGILFQTPIYGWFVVSAVREVPQAALWILAWIMMAIAVTWPKFPRVIVPTFLNDVKGFVTGSDDLSDRWGSD